MQETYKVGLALGVTALSLDGWFAFGATALPHDAWPCYAGD